MATSAVDLLSAFRTRHPEFFKTLDAIVVARLADAAEQCSEEVYAELYTQAVCYKAADLLAKSPYNQKARATPTTTVYSIEFDRLNLIVACGPRVF